MTRLRVAHTRAAASFVALLGVFCAASCFVRCTHSRPRLRVYSKAEAGHAAPPPRTSIEWDDLGFGLTTRDTQMVVATCPRDGEWNSFKVEPYGALSLEPAATVLNYGQGIFEGLKAFRTSKGRTVLFRPEKNAQRMASGAERFLMPPVPKELFLEMCYEAVRANADWVPPEGKGSLYLRPLLMGSGAALGVGPSPEFTFVIYVAPVGSYFSGGGARLRVETSHHRAADLGVGYVKAAGNYAPCFQPQKDAKEKGFSDVLYLDPSGKRVEEAAASNFFCVTKDGKLKTPALGTILAGVTRDSILQLARRLATQSDLINSVEETSITLDEILQAKEAFVTGTAAAVTPVGHVASDDGSVDLEVPGPVTAKLKETFQELQQELQPDEEGWLVDVFA